MIVKRGMCIVLVLIAVCSLCLILSSCGGNTDGTQTVTGKTDVSDTINFVNDAEQGVTNCPELSGYDTQAEYDDTSAVKITLADNASVSSSASAVLIDGNTVTVHTPGTYVFSGSLSDGSVVVRLQKTEKAQLVFANVNICSKTGSPVYVSSADKVVITLADSSVNTLSDAVVYGSEETNACLFSNDDLTINGNGTLNVTGNANNGIGTKNDLKIVSGTITVSAVNNAIKGNDSVVINSGNITVTGCDDAIKSDTADEAEKGYIRIYAGTINITAADDGLQASNEVTVSGGKLNITAGGKPVNTDGKATIADGCLVY